MTQTWTDRFHDKLIAPDDLEQWADAVRRDGKSIATLNGSFDLLHAGHLHILYQAAQAADVLIVALNSDASIQAYKSPLRPIISLENRLQMMAALSFVDYVTWFEETNPIELLKKIRPNVHCNGAEYGEECIEARTVRDQGGRIVIIDLVPGLSTSQIIERIQHTCV